MKRAIHIPAFIALIAALLLSGSGFWWLWRRSVAQPGEIRCNNGGYSVMACDTDFGNYATALILVAAPIIAWLLHKAFFTRFKAGR